MPFSRLSSSRMVVPLPSSRCLAEGNIIFASVLFHCKQFQEKLCHLAYPKNSNCHTPHRVIGPHHFVSTTLVNAKPGGFTFTFGPSKLVILAEFWNQLANMMLKPGRKQKKAWGPHHHHPVLTSHHHSYFTSRLQKLKGGNEGGGFKAGGGDKLMLLPRRGMSCARKREGPSATPPHRPPDSLRPNNAPWIRGHYCATRADVQTVLTYRVSTTLT